MGHDGHARGAVRGVLQINTLLSHYKAILILNLKGRTYGKEIDLFYPAIFGFLIWWR